MTDVRGKARLNHAAPQEIPFSYFGPLAVGSESPPWVSAVDATVVALRALLRVAGTTQTVVTVYKNDVAVKTLVIPAAQRNVGEPVEIDLLADQDHITMAATTVGTGAESLVVIARLL